MESAAEKLDNSQRKNLINEEIKKGETDEVSVKSIRNHNGSPEVQKNPDGENTKNFTRDDYCRAKFNAFEATRGPKTVNVRVYDKPCTLTKRKPPLPRKCMSKQEWIDILATPSQKCLPSAELKRTETRNLRAISARINELARPTRARMIATLQDRGATLPAPLVDRLITVLETESCLTPEQAERLFRDARKKKKRKINKIECREKKHLKTIHTNATTTTKIEAANCQYSLAENFVKSILQWECPVPREEFSDISQVLFQRLQRQFYYKNLTITADDRVTPVMRLISDIGAAWIVGVLLEVALTKKEELEKEREERRKKTEDTEDDDDDEDDVIDGLATTTDDDDYSTDNDDDDDDNDDDSPDHGGGKSRGGSRDRHDDDKDREQRENEILHTENDDKDTDNVPSEMNKSTNKNKIEIMEAMARAPDEIADTDASVITGNILPTQVYKQMSAITHGNWRQWAHEFYIDNHNSTLVDDIL